MKLGNESDIVGWFSAWCICSIIIIWYDDPGWLIYTPTLESPTQKCFYMPLSTCFPVCTTQNKVFETHVVMDALPFKRTWMEEL